MKNRTYSLTFILTIYTFILLSVFSGILLYWTYNTTSTLLIEEIKHSFKQRKNSAYIFFQDEQKKLESLNLDIVKSNSLNQRIILRDTYQIKNHIETLSRNKNYDILLVTDFNKNILASIGSPIFSSEDIGNKIINTNISDHTGIYDIETRGTNLAVVISSKKIISNDGRIIGHIYSAIILENNFSIINEIKKSTDSDIIILNNGKRVISSSKARDSRIISGLFENQNPENFNKLGLVHIDDSGYIYTSDKVHVGGNSNYYIMFAITSTPLDNLKREYFYKALVIVILGLVSILFSVIIINIITHTPLSQLINYSEDVEKSKKFEPYRESYIEEFNKVGFQLEAMIRSMKASEEQVKQFASSTWEAMIIHDNGKIIEVNTQFYAMFNYNETDTIIGTYITPHYLLTNIENLTSYDQIHNSNGKELVALKKGGTQFDVEVRTREVVYNKSDVYIISIRDITVRKQMAELMIQTEKMMSLGGLAAGMAHEINNPLASIVQNASVMENRLSNKLNINKSNQLAIELGTSIEVIHEYMERRGIFNMLHAIKSSSHHISDIVGNMLGFARKDKDNFKLTSVNDIVEKSLELSMTDYDLRKEYDFKSVKIVKELDMDLPPINCIPSKLQQVILNILHNGAQALHDNGTINPQITLRTSYNSDNLEVVIEIEDNGPGIEFEIQNQIFDPFFTTKDLGKGTGLGLSVSYFIINENLNGNIKVLSTPGEGATFIITLPA